MNPNILAVIIYGSHARKDNDSASDFDVCVITKSAVEQESYEPEILSLLNIPVNNKVEITSYPHETICSMLKYGSLFLWHLKEEGIVVYGAEYFNQVINDLSPYHHHIDELIYHQKIFNDLKEAYKIICEPNEFDLSLLFTICRNTCMILSDKYDIHEFGRFSCYYAARKLFKNIPVSQETYQYLSDWKNSYERNLHIPPQLPTTYYFEELIQSVENLLNFAFGKIPQHD